jgi:hypothetical protein
LRKECIECGQVFSGRSDARFCSGACRSAYHNRVNSGDRETVVKTNSILKKNRKILAKLNKTGTARVKRTILLTEGFNFSYLTNIYTTSKGKTYKYCYDQGYLDTDEDYLTLVVKKDYVA